MSEKVYVVEFKNLKTDNWVKGKEYKTSDELCKHLDITKPTMRNLIKNGSGTYSKFLKISIKYI